MGVDQLILFFCFLAVGLCYYSMMSRRPLIRRIWMIQVTLRNLQDSLEIATQQFKQFNQCVFPSFQVEVPKKSPEIQKESP